MMKRPMSCTCRSVRLVQLGIDIGNGVVLRYDEAAREVVGVTLIGLQAQLHRELSDQE